MSGMAQRIAPQLLNMRSRDQQMHRVLKVALQPWTALVGTTSFGEYTTEHKSRTHTSEQTRSVAMIMKTLRSEGPIEGLLWIEPI